MPRPLPPLPLAQVLAWADSHRRRTGDWPRSDSRPAAHHPRERWRNPANALRDGPPALPGGSSLARLLAQQRGARNVQDLPPLTERQILAWAAAHRQRTGRWSNEKSGRGRGAPSEVWHNIDQALRHGTRGLPAGSRL